MAQRKNPGRRTTRNEECVSFPVENLSALILGIMLLTDSCSVREIKEFLLKKNEAMGGKSPLEYLRDNDLSDKAFRAEAAKLRRSLHKNA